MTTFISSATLSGRSGCGGTGAVDKLFYDHPMSRKLSGVALEQTADANAYSSSGYVFQEFRFPSNFPRGADPKIPAITGFAILATTTGESTGDYIVDQYIDDYGWSPVAWGTTSSKEVSASSAVEDAVWLNVFFNAQDITQTWTRLFRIGFNPTSNITKIWYTTPNPMSAYIRALASDGVTPLAGGGSSSALNFKIYTATADDGSDFLGNTYRSLVVRNEAVNVDTTDALTKDKFWLSKPNPSQFAIENLFFDLRQGTDPVVVDRVYLDPVTPDVWFNVYYSNDATPGYNEDSWNDLMWTRVPRKFHALRADEFAFPEPVRGRFFKIEFTHLQPRLYAPGNFQTPIIYKKHPKWVLDYFLALYAQQTSTAQFNSPTVNLRYDAIDLAYRYYSDDINQSALSPTAIESAVNVNKLVDFLKSESTENTVDLETLVQINRSMQPFLNQPFMQGREGYLLSEYMAQEDVYSVEQIKPTISRAAQRVSEEQAQLVLEKNFPVTSFYLPCRHKYRVSQGYFDNDRAYFAGVYEVAFTREKYVSRYDTDVYIESVGDNINVESNDFEWEDGAWVVNTSGYNLANRIDTGTDPSP